MKGRVPAAFPGRSEGQVVTSRERRNWKGVGKGSRNQGSDQAFSRLKGLPGPSRTWKGRGGDLRDVLKRGGQKAEVHAVLRRMGRGPKENTENGWKSRARPLSEAIQGRLKLREFKNKKG